MSDQIQSTIETLQARADACMASGERRHAGGLIEAIQALRRIVPPAPPVAPPAPPRADAQPAGHKKLLGVF